VTAVTGSFAGLYCLVSFEQQRGFRTGYDSTIFDQAVHSYSRLRGPISPVKGVHDFGIVGYNLLADHFSPIWAVLAPFYRLWPSIGLLFVAQSVLFAASGVPVWRFTRRALGRRAAYLVLAGYGLAWGLQSALGFDVHEIMFAVPLTALAVERADAGRPGQAVAAASVLLVVKEQFGLFLAGFGVYLAVRGYRRLGALTALGGLAAFELTVNVLIPHFAAGHHYAYFTDTVFRGGLPAALGFAVRHPVRLLRLFVLPGPKWRTLLWLTAPWGFAALGSPLALLAVPLLLVRFLGTDPHWWGTAFQYDAELMPLAVLAAVDGIRRVRSRLPRLRSERWALGWAAAVLGGAVWACTRFPFGQLGATAEWSTTAAVAAAEAAVAHVPPGVTVEAPAQVGPHLVDRDTVLLLDPTPRNAPWVVVGSRAPAADRTARLESAGYHVVFADDGYVVLNRP